MKVLLVNKFHFLKGGAERFYFTLAQAFESLNDEVCFFSMQDELNVSCKQEKFFVKHASTEGNIFSKIRLIRNMRYNKSAYKKMTALLRQENPQLVVVNNFHKHLTFSVIKAIKDYNLNLPVVWVAHDLIGVCPVYTMINGKGEMCDKCLDGNYFHCVENRCVRGSKFLSKLSAKEAKSIKDHNYYSLFDKVVCPSKFYADTLIKGGFDKEKVMPLTNPLSIDFKYETYSEHKNYLFFFGRLSKEKGVDLLIEAVKGSDKQLIIAGTGPEEKYLKELAFGCDNIKFVGFKKGEELEELIKNAKFVCVPSLCENCSYSIMESLAKGKPCIATNVGGNPELVKNGVNGFLFETVEQLRELINKDFSEEEYLEMCKNATKFAIEKFDAKKYVKTIKRIVALDK